MRHRIPTIITAAATCTAALIAVSTPAQAAPGVAHHSAATAHGHAATPAASGSGLLSYGGGTIVTSPRVYIVYWGSQWGTSSITNDPSGEAALQLSFFNHAFGSGDTLFTSQTQYCQGVARGTTQCGSSGTHVGHPASSPVAGTWLDSASAAPSRPSATQLATEASRAAAHFGVSGDNIQIIVDSPHNVVPSGFKTQYCAYHDLTSSGGGDVPFTNMPYITDAGTACGSNFIAATGGISGATEGITIVGGHEYAETLTDPQAGSGWLDRSGFETGDKCAWISSGQGASAVVAMNGANFAVQSEFSNNFNNGAGNCVTFYASATNQH